MNEILKGDLNDLELILNQVKAEGLEFLKGINDRRTSTNREPMEYSNLEAQGSGALAALAAFKSRFDDIIVASTGPRYWGFVTGGATPAAIAGDWLATIYDQNTQTVKGQGDISANIELETVRLLLQLLGLPEEAYLGGFVTGATMSNFSCLAVARQWLGAQQGYDVAKTGVSGTLKVLSAMPHSSAVKSLALLGLGSQNLIKVKVMPGNREAMDMNDLEQQIQELKGAPFILISSAGTVNTVDFDDFEAISKLRGAPSLLVAYRCGFRCFCSLCPGLCTPVKRMGAGRQHHGRLP
jgi:glutamate/tyrosine decarboxylase-like PLP-dependent enzyme